MINFVNTSKWTREQAVQWLAENPEDKETIDRLDRDGVLEKLDMLLGHRQPIDLALVAHIAGYKTGRA